MLYHLIGSIPRVYSAHRPGGSRTRRVYDWPVIGTADALSERQAIARFAAEHGARPETVRVQYVPAKRERQLEAFLH